MALPLMAQEANTTLGKFVITGEVKNVPDGAVIRLRRDLGSMWETIGRDTIRKGKFVLADTISCVNRFSLASGDTLLSNGVLQVWVAPGKQVHVSGQDKWIGCWLAESDMPEQQEENAFQACAGDLRREFEIQNTAERGWFYVLDTEGVKNPAVYQTTRIKLDSLRSLSLPLWQSIQERELAYMRTVPVGPVWLIKLADLALSATAPIPGVQVDRKAVEALYESLSDEQKLTEKAREAAWLLYPDEVLYPGDEMADAVLYDADGGRHRLAELQGKYILLDFWMSGCAPCIQSIPEMEEVAEIYQDSLAVVGISLDPEKIWKKALQKRQPGGYQWNELVKPNRGLAAKYQVKSYPTYVLIAPDGRIKAQWVGYGKGVLRQQLHKWLNN